VYGMTQSHGGFGVYCASAGQVIILFEGSYADRSMSLHEFEVYIIDYGTSLM
jgi:hypothetical protein